MLNDLALNCADAWPVHDRYVFGDARLLNGVAICDHDFDALAGAAPPGPRGWEGFFELYHLDRQPWAYAPWAIVDLATFVDRLDIAAPALDVGPESLARIDVLMTYLKAKRAAGEAVYMQRR